MITGKENIHPQGSKLIYMQVWFQILQSVCSQEAALKMFSTTKADYVAMEHVLYTPSFAHASWYIQAWDFGGEK